MPTATVDLTGKWKVRQSTNFDAFLSELGMNWLTRKAASKAALTLDIAYEHEGKKVTIKSISPIKTKEETFEVNGKEFEGDTPMGGKAKVTARWGDKQLILVCSDPNDHPRDKNAKQITITRELTTTDGKIEMKQTMKCGDVECVRMFTKAT